MALVLAAGFGSTTAEAAGLRATDICVLTKPTKLERKKDKPVELKVGTRVVVLARDGNNLRVKDGKNEGTVDARTLERQCEPPTAPTNTSPTTTGAAAPEAAGKSVAQPSPPPASPNTTPGLATSAATASSATAVSSAAEIPADGLKNEPEISLSTPKASAESAATASAVEPNSDGLIDEPELPVDRKTRVAVFSFSATADDASAIEKKAIAVLGKSSAFQLVPNKTLRTAQQQHKRDCKQDDACLAAVARRAKADFFIAGSVDRRDRGPSKASDKGTTDKGLIEKGLTQIDVRLLDSKRAKPIDRSQRLLPSSNSASLADDVALSLQQIVRKLDPDQFGRLVLRVYEQRTANPGPVRPELQGAQVRIDDRQVGLSPLAPRPMATGAYTLDVTMDGWKPAHIPFDIEPQADTEISLTLAHSDAFLNAYRSQAKTRRVLAISAFAVGGASAIACGAFVIYGNVKNQDTFDRYFAAGRTLNAQELSDVRKIRSGIATTDALAVVTGVVAAAAITTGIVLWLTGDDPAAYDTPKVALVPVLGGLLVSGTL